MDASVYVAAIGAIAAVVCAVISTRTHREVKTNHGVRNGQRIEDLTEDVRFIRRTMVSKNDLQEHADHDEVVARELAVHVEQTKQETLAAIREERGN